MDRLAVLLQMVVYNFIRVLIARHFVGLQDLVFTMIFVFIRSIIFFVCLGYLIALGFLILMFVKPNTGIL